MSPLNPLNPLTGDVPVPEDPREIETALRAGRVTYRIFPYFEWRYGERGRSFTKSDSAWLVWLTRHDQDYVLQQILWLGSVLSNRGMPRWLLETHLRVLFRHLQRALPARESSWQRLASAAGHLRQLREEVLPTDQIEALAADFCRHCGSAPGRLLLGTGRLLACAVADQHGGIRNATSSVMDWFVQLDNLRGCRLLRAALPAGLRARLDEDSFADQWSEGVDKLVQQAEQLGRSRTPGTA